MRSVQIVETHRVGSSGFSRSTRFKGFKR